MNMDLIDKVIKPLDNFIDKETETLPFSQDNSFTPIKLDTKNFHQLSLFSNNKTLIAIDGGNAEILNAPSLSLSFIRIAAVSYKENKKIKTIKKEFFCLVKAENNNNKLFYSIEIFGDDLFKTNLNFNSVLETLGGEKYNLEISSIPNIIRRYAELKLANETIENNSNLVIDGSIQAKNEEEVQLIKDLLKKAEEKNTTIGFLSKTCRLLTKNASSLNSSLNELGPKSTWFYHPVFKISNPNFLGDIFFIKLHQKSKYVFKLEFNIGQNADDYVLSLATNSTDPIFYGYPFALIEADRSARVTNQEKEYLKTIFISKIKNKEKLKYLLSNLDVHDILDNIS